MKEELVSYKTVKLAQKKGIDFRSKEFSQSANKTNKAGIYHSYVTQSLLQKYLREKHKINVTSCYCEYAIKSCNSWNFTLDNPTGRQYWQGNSKTYEEALEKGLQEALKLIKL